MALLTALEGKLNLPVVASPLLIVSNPEPVIAECCAGIVGSFPTARPKEALNKWLARIKRERTDFQAANPYKQVAPFAVNQIVHHSNSRVDADMDVCIEHEVPIIITSLRSPASLVDKVHHYGGIVLHDVINVRHARKAIDAA
jgi:nitronate monooxygenase